MAESAGKVIVCRAAVCWAPHKPLTIENIQVAVPKEGEIRVKVLATGVCGTDAHCVFRNDSPPTDYPMVLGHEGCGEVECVGSGVTCVKQGDKVVLLWATTCGKCDLCQKSHFCRERRNLKGEVPPLSSLSLNGEKLGQFFGTSTFSEYTVVRDFDVVKIDNDLPADQMCLIGCQLPTGIGASINSAGVEPGDTVAIWGLGGIGLAAVIGAKIAGAKRIIGVDTNPGKFELAKKVGVTDCLNPKDYSKPISEIIKELTEEGCDKAIECIGNVDCMREACLSTRLFTGKTVIVGCDHADVSVPSVLFLRGLTLVGTSYGGYKGTEAAPALIKLWREGKIPIKDIITHRITLDDINKGFELMKSGKSARTVVMYQ